MVKFAWFFGRVALLVEYFEQIGPDEIEGGARVEIRRVEQELIPGAPAAVSGFRVLPVTEGIWRADLFHLLNRPGDHPIYHYHPNFHDGDVGEREFDPKLTTDHLEWALAQVVDLKGILRRTPAALLLAGRVEWGGDEFHIHKWRPDAFKALLGRFFATRPLVAHALARWGHVLLPAVLVGIGLLILIEGGAFGL